MHLLNMYLQITIFGLSVCLFITACIWFFKFVIKKKESPYINDKSEVDNLLDPKWDCEAVN